MGSKFFPFSVDIFSEGNKINLENCLSRKNVCQSLLRIRVILLVDPQTTVLDLITILCE